ncbi:exopolysaccharide transport family protein [Porphyromonas pogonae]|uniref:exopolysaccharide transport family protein n=1 Tax=Porphyromonas pogonae TaxID=867595 RepID=UPI002E77E6EC|nr:polysaccharide biosynthesis tyrosine autokinase [Porphyromonas pogonae]
MEDLYSKPNTPYNEEGEAQDLKAIISKYIIHWRWFVASVIVCILAAMIYMRYAQKQYDISATIMFKEEKNKQGAANEMMSLQNLGILATTNNVTNEMEILQSKTIVKKTVIALKAYNSYKTKGSVGTNYLFYNYPLEVNTSDSTLDKLMRPFSFTAKPQTNGSLEVVWKDKEENTHKESFSKFPAVLKTDVGDFELVPRKNYSDFFDESVYISVTAPIEVAKNILTRMSVDLANKTSSVAVIHFKSLDKDWGEEFINTLIKTYNDDSRMDKNLVAVRTAEFINERLDIISKELGTTEKRIEDTKRSAGLTTVEDYQMVVKGRADINKDQLTVSTQLYIMEDLKKYVDNPANKNQVIPSNIGLDDETLKGIINQYNEKLLERNRLIRSSSENNPIVIKREAELETLRNNVSASIASAYRGLKINARAIQGQVNLYNEKISNAPTQERVLTDINRQQEIKAKLFLMLLEKREENSIAMAATADNAKIIDEALASTNPISPKKPLILAIGLLLGLILPVLIITILDFFRTKIESHSEVEKLTKLPIIGDIPFERSARDSAIVVKKNDNNLMSEVFRTLRTNIQFTLKEDEKVIMFTSTISGEGKSFVSSNLAVSLALLGKKVIIIGMDIRNPQLHNVFGFKNPRKGLTNIIAENSLDYEPYIITAKETENLHILNAGATPPNPAELLDRPALDLLMKKFRQHYEYVIIDSAPVGLVVDSLVASRIADTTVYVSRENYTEKSAFELINTLYREHKLPNISIVINGVDLKKVARSHYGYGKRYGYGGYGYGYSYGNNSQTQNKPKNIFQKLLGMFKKGN